MRDMTKKLIGAAALAATSLVVLSTAALAHNGGRLQDITLGLNWFLNPNMKIQTNYTHTIRDSIATPDGSSYDGVGMRLAWDF